MTDIAYLALIEECIQIFLTDSSQYLIISWGDADWRSKFLEDFSRSAPFENTMIIRETLQTVNDLETIFRNNATNNISIYFLDNPLNISIEEIRAIIDTHRIDAKIILTSAERAEWFFATNFSLPQQLNHNPPSVPTTTEALEWIWLVDENTKWLLELHDEHTVGPLWSEAENIWSEIPTSHTINLWEAPISEEIDLFSWTLALDPLASYQEESTEVYNDTPKNAEEVVSISDSLQWTPTPEEVFASTVKKRTQSSKRPGHTNSWTPATVPNISTISPLTDLPPSPENTDFLQNPYRSFREFAAQSGMPIEVSQFLQGHWDITRLSLIFDTYTHTRNTSSEDQHLEEQFREKLTHMQASLFPKEYDVFMEYIRTIGMHIGKLFKEDQLAQILGISRRKIKKYTQILKEHHIITEITPLYTQKDRELSRHSKLYFTDLLWYQYVLGNMYSIGAFKTGMIENFVFLELIHKLHESHAIHFWRKKSGTEIAFVLRSYENDRLTPIHITLKTTQSIPQSIQWFCEVYHNTLESGMILNTDHAGVVQHADITFLILPHPII